MSSRKKKLLLNGHNRRDFLKGLGSIAVGLPVFDFMLNSNGTAYAQGLALPQRFVTLYNGVGIGWKEGHQSYYQPDKTGSDYDLKPGIKALANYNGLQDYTSIVTNQRIPYKKWSESKYADPGPGGLCGMFHRCAGLVQLSGTRVIELEKKKYKSKSSPTADSIYAEFLGQKPFYYTISATSYEWHKFVPNLDFKRLTSRFYGFDMQVDKNGTHLQTDNNPQRVYNELVGLSSSLSKNNPNNNWALIEMQTQRKSILDFIDKRRVQYLERNLSSKNKSKLSDHFDFIRQIEKEIIVGETAPTLACNIPNKNLNYGDINTSSRWSDENKRTEAWTDVLTLAFQCDAIRSGMLQITEGQSTISLKNMTGLDRTYHESGHGPSNGQHGIEKYSEGYNWHVNVLGQLAQKLKNTSEGSGNILDNSALVLCSEGGTGLSSDDGQNNSTHSVDNMVSIICGKAGGLKGGVHVKTNKSHPSKVLISAMNACSNGKITQLGEVSGVVDELFS